MPAFIGFPCLAILRYTVATVVTVLALVLIGRVIFVGVRPDHVIVSIVEGHVCTTKLWNGDDDDFSGRLPPTSRKRPVYTPVDALTLQVILSMDNPGGRGSIFCKSVQVTFHAGMAAAGMEIGALRSSDFHVKPQTSHKIAESLKVYNTTVLEYIAHTYGGKYRFTGTVEVTMNTSFAMQMGHQTNPRIDKFVCSPVDFSVVVDDATDTTDTDTAVQCIKSN